MRMISIEIVQVVRTCTKTKPINTDAVQPKNSKKFVQLIRNFHLKLSRCHNVVQNC